jgi:hypothetical protein
MSLLASAMRSPGTHIAVSRGRTGPGAHLRQLPCGDLHWTQLSTVVAGPLRSNWPEACPRAGRSMTSLSR